MTESGVPDTDHSDGQPATDDDEENEKRSEQRSNAVRGEWGEETQDSIPPADVANEHTLDMALTYSRDRDYIGWDYGDGMSSRFLQALPVQNRLLNMAVQEIVKRSPINVRPLLLVEQRRNFKGAALFAMTNLTLARLTTDEINVDETVDYRGEAERLLDWLVENRARDQSGFGVGHQHPIQDIQGLADANEPGSVCTSYATKALLRGSELDERYPTVAETAADFVVEDLDYRPTEHGARITYSQNHEGNYYTINAGALAGRLFVDLYDHFGEGRFRDRAREMLDHIAALQEDCGGWQYRDPPSASHLSMDTHHNGFIIETFQRYEAATGDGRYDDVLERSLAFYRGLFDENGAPHFDVDSRYPRDIHACAQGILVFTYADDLPRARRILEWTIDNLYAGDGRFYFRKHRLYTQRVTLMRWCQAWMCFAMSEYLRAIKGEHPIESV